MLKRAILGVALVAIMTSVSAIADVVDDKAKFDTALAFEVTQASSEAFDLVAPEPVLTVNASIAFERIQAGTSAFMKTTENNKPIALAQVDVLSVNLPNEVGWQI